MPAHEIIALSSDTDDGRTQRKRKSPRAKHIEHVTGFHSIDDYDHDAPAIAPPDQPRKKRRLSPACVSDDDVVEVVAELKHASPRPARKVVGLATCVGPSTGAVRGEKAGLRYGGGASKGLGGSKWHDISDPILFTSSPCGEIQSDAARKDVSTETPSSGDDLPDLAALRKVSVDKSRYSERTAAIIENFRARRANGGDGGNGTRDTQKSGAAGRQGSSLVEVTNTTVVVKRKKLTDAEKKVREMEKEQAKAEKVREREEDKERKRKLKENKAREKQLASDLAEVNKRKTDKKISTPEMIIDIPASLEGNSVDTQIREFHRNLQVQTTTYDSAVPNVVRWRRKVTAKYNEEMGHWEPMPEEIQQEKHVLCIVSAKEFVDMASAGPGEDHCQDLEGHVRNLRSKYEDSLPVYLIEGLEAWMRKNKNTRNRAYQAAVLDQMDCQDPEQSKTGNRRRKKTSPTYIDEDMVEDALLRLQVIHGCLIHHTAAPVETAEWVANFTQHISTIPYRTQTMNLNTSFCMDVGQVKTGDDKDDTYVKMLQEVVRVTAPIAYGVAAEYPSVVDLVRGFSTKGPMMLENVKKCTNKNGAFSDARIGPALSKRLYKVFTGTDPLSNDV